ncbi:TetR/AcrR family transcriptional regulator [Actinoplanes solisilvae]|uniref:TetR/AcrR family transcriptional regulator n=1 Tax=Actinoplanes solisilvae TaxID=2486853 RepID=UPI001F0C7851|nr:TetR/AcrR family transcriptional regulator [Actinoplanes solisilvae]
MRLNRVQQQARTRATVLAAARAEFATHGYAEAKIDRIAERASLTRGAVYSNFPSKRALYLAVLLDDAGAARAAGTPRTAGTAGAAGVRRRGTLDDAGTAGSLGPADGIGAFERASSAEDLVLTGGVEALDLAGLGGALDVAGAVEAFARVWLERLPLAVDSSTAGRLQAHSLTGVVDDERGRAALAQVTRLEAVLLGLALESCRARDSGRRVRLAELILTMLHGAGQLAETAPGFGDPFDVARACRHLAGLPLADEWDPPYLPFVAAARPVRESWSPPAPPSELTDELSGRRTGFDADGLIVVLGADRLEAAEEAIRAADPHEVVTVAVVTDDSAETGALVRLRLTDLTAGLRRVFGPAIRPSLRLVLDDHGVLASAIGTRTTPGTEAAIRVRSGEIVARAEGRGAAATAEPR